MLKTTHLKGFTIIELLVAMALTSIIMMLGMATISHFIRFFNEIKKNSERQTAIIQFYEVLNHDVNRSEKVFWDEKIICINTDQTISYQFNKEFIVRSINQNYDTLRIFLTKRS